MEPLTAGAIALVFIGSKFLEWSTNKAFDLAYDHAKLALAEKSPQTAHALAATAEQREDIGIAVLVNQVEKAAQADPEIRDAIEALGNQTNVAAINNPSLAKAIEELTQIIKAEKLPSPNLAKIAETIGINEQKILGGEVYQTFGQGGITIDKRQI